MKKNMLLLLVFAILFSMSAGVYAEKVVLEWTTCCAQTERHEAFQKLAAMYMEKNPNVEIQWSAPAGYTNQMSVLFAAGSAPDVIWMGQGLYAFADFLMPLNVLLEKDPNVKDINPTLLQFTTYQGKLLGVPYGAISSGLFYNKDLFNAAGLSYPSANWSFDDVVATARRLTKDSTGDEVIDVYGMGQMHRAWDAWWAYTWGGDFYTPDGKQTRLDNPVSTASLQWYADHSNSKFVPYTGPAQKDVTMFNGRVAMNAINVLEIDQMKKSANFDWDVTMMPTFNHNGTAYKNSQVNVEEWAINKDTKHPSVALDFVSFLVSPEAMRVIGEAGFIIPSQRRNALHFYNIAAPPTNMGVFFESMEYGKVYHYWHPLGSDINAYMHNSQAWKDMWAGKMPASQAVPEIARGVNAMLDEYFNRK